MSEQMQTGTAPPTQASEQDQRIALEALAGAVGGAAQQLARRSQTDAVATAAFTIMFAAMPETARLRSDRVLAILTTVLKDQPLELQQQVGALINGLIKM